MKNDDLNAARGIFMGMLIGLWAWAIFLLVLGMKWRHGN